MGSVHAPAGSVFQDPIWSVRDPDAHVSNPLTWFSVELLESSVQWLLSNVSDEIKM